MSKEYLSTGFTDVDHAKDKHAYFDCLTLLDSLPYYKEYKTKSYDLLDLRPGMTVLEAGCGLGDDAFRMAERINPGGKVVGLDTSNAMLEKARSRALMTQLPVEFLLGDVKALPFPDNSFARCRIDRVLQHIPQPQDAVAELIRVLEPNGLLLAYDNDWETFSITSTDHEIARTIEHLWRDSFANTAIGRHLRGYFISGGVSNVSIHPGTSVITDFTTADKVYNLKETVHKAVEDGYISISQGRAWIEELMDRTRQGSFVATLTAYTVVGRKTRKS
ncbi:MAG: class I SAM-dependent methyltransferase [Deltaproteobacteria bacterium HGW-Deltaproteobacteria-6]|jgi:ubiquinone/menaquinone biosynthesis C-methylase UbiE|nr:MAG: class I SAM-dependent methyltransferase [Deltaproteobacteria bacterium HGW-Deltaproteobacteria-6]PKN95656.1 MAG: class I SAM-dependent methyltransferase [Chloroflexi bacterium HGW-Chloroflexi-5]